MANACKAIAYEQSQWGALFTVVGGLVYLILAGLMLLIPGLALNYRKLIVFLLMATILGLLYTKFFITEEGEDNYFLIASEVLAGLTKRLLLVLALASDPETSPLGRLIQPYTFASGSVKKTKKE